LFRGNNNGRLFVLARARDACIKNSAFKSREKNRNILYILTLYYYLLFSINDLLNFEVDIYIGMI